MEIDSINKTEFSKKKKKKKKMVITNIHEFHLVVKRPRNLLKLHEQPSGRFHLKGLSSILGRYNHFLHIIARAHAILSTKKK